MLRGPRIGTLSMYFTFSQASGLMPESCGLAQYVASLQDTSYTSRLTFLYIVLQEVTNIDFCLHRGAKPESAFCLKCTMMFFLMRHNIDIEFMHAIAREGHTLTPSVVV